MWTFSVSSLQCIDSLLNSSNLVVIIKYTTITNNYLLVPDYLTTEDNMGHIVQYLFITTVLLGVTYGSHFPKCKAIQSTIGCKYLTIQKIVCINFVLYFYRHLSPRWYNNWTWINFKYNMYHQPYVIQRWKTCVQKK